MKRQTKLISANILTRAKTVNDIPSTKIKQAAEEEELECRTHEDGYLTIIGDRNRIQSFIKRVTELQKEKQ